MQDCISAKSYLISRGKLVNIESLTPFKTKKNQSKFRSGNLFNSAVVLPATAPIAKAN